MENKRTIDEDLFFVVVDGDVSSMGHICCDLRIVCAKGKQALALVPLHRAALMTVDGQRVQRAKGKMMKRISNAQIDRAWEPRDVHR